MYQIEKMTNGLEVMRVPMSGVESVSVVVMARTGSRYEKPKAYGVAHFLEHMVFKGTKKFPTTKVISETVDSIGAQFNAFTSEEATAFYIRSASKDLDLSLEMLGQLTTQPLILPEEIDKERGVILEEMHMYEDQPASYNSILFNEMFYGKSGLAHNILGTKETIKKITRNDFDDYLNSWYGPDNLLIVVAGKKETVMADDLIKKIEQYFEFDQKRQKHSPQNELWEKCFQYGPKSHFEQRKTEQIHWIAGWPGITNFDKRENELNLLSTIVGGNMSSRLFLQVREQRGLCYYINSQADFFADAGFFGATAGVNPEKLVEAVAVTVEQFEALAEGVEAVNEKELIKAKNYLAGHLTLAQESVHNLAISYGMRYLLTGEVLTIKERLQALQKVELQAVRELAKNLINRESLRISLIGEIKDEQRVKIEKLLEK